MNPDIRDRIIDLVRELPADVFNDVRLTIGELDIYIERDTDGPYRFCWGEHGTNGWTREFGHLNLESLKVELDNLIRADWPKADPIKIAVHSPDEIVFEPAKGAPAELTITIGDRDFKYIRAKKEVSDD